jgi:site-specific recombinase XerD
LEKPKKKERGIRERNGKFYYRHSIKDPITGKRKQKESPGFATIGQARQEGIRIEAEKLYGTYIEEQDIMFKDWVDRWLVLYASSGKVKNSTVDIRRDSLKRAKKSFAGLELKEVTRLQYQSLLDNTKAEGKSKRTVELLHEACRMLFSKAVSLELIKVSPAAGAEIPTYPDTVEQLENATELPQFLEKEQLAKLLKTAKANEEDPQGYHALFVLAYTGLRIGELCALKETDIDHINKQISITKTLYNAGAIKDYELNTPKTKSSIRKIDVSETVLFIINKQIAWRKEYKMAVRKKFTDKLDKLNFLFVNNQKNPGYPAPIAQFEKVMSRMLTAAELPDTLSPHSLRHTYTSLMAEAGVELEAIQRLLGHQNDRVTRSIYLHVTKAKKKEAVEKLDELMKGLL